MLPDEPQNKAYISTYISPNHTVPRDDHRCVWLVFLFFFFSVTNSAWLVGCSRSCRCTILCSSFSSNYLKCTSGIWYPFNSAYVNHHFFLAPAIEQYSSSISTGIDGERWRSDARRTEKIATVESICRSDGVFGRFRTAIDNCLPSRRSCRLLTLPRCPALLLPCDFAMVFYTIMLIRACFISRPVWFHHR